MELENRFHANRVNGRRVSLLEGELHSIMSEEGPMRSTKEQEEVTFVYSCRFWLLAKFR